MTREPMHTHKIGALVKVGPAYQGAGRFAPDGYEGIYTVVGHLAPGDLYLARGDCRASPGNSLWDVIMHESRVSAFGGGES